MGSHRGNSHELVLQGLRAAGVTEAVYLACAIGSGLREFALMAALQVFDRDTLRSRHHLRWRNEVFDPNIAGARAVAHQIRDDWQVSVIDPTYFDVPGFSQFDYDALCAEVIRTHARALALAPAWQYSRGARVEVKLALNLGLPILDTDGNALAEDRLCELAEEAEDAITAMGVMPPLGGPSLLPSLVRLTA